MRRRFLRKPGIGRTRVISRHIQRAIFGNKKEPSGFILFPNGERCRELIDAADEMTRRLYCVVDWLALHPEYNPKTKVIPKKDYPVLVDVTF